MSSEPSGDETRVKPPWQQPPAFAQPWQPPAAAQPWQSFEPPGQPGQVSATTRGAGADRRVVVAGIACVVVTVLSVALRSAGALPSGLATVIVLVVVGLGLRLYVAYASKAANSPRGARVSKLIALAGLAVSGVTVCVALPVLLKDGGTDTFVADLFAHLWTLALLLLAVGTARTFGWQVLVGMGVTGFLAVTGAAYTVGRPVVEALGSDSTLATVVVVPLTEEILKALPVVLLIVFAVRRTAARPSAVELALVGACVGAGFALYENTRFHRGGFEFAMPPLSVLNPSATDNGDYGVTYFVAGHMIYTATICLGVAVTVYYRRQVRRARFALPVAIALPVLEHITQNYSAIVLAGGGNEALFDALRVLTLWGWASSLAFLAGIVWFARLERGAVAGYAPQGAATAQPGPQRLLSAVWLTPSAAARAGAALADLQRAASDPDPNAAPRARGGVR